MNQQLIHATQIKVGDNRGTPRVWVEGKFLNRAGLGIGEAYDVDASRGELLVFRSPKGKRKVSGRKNNTMPIIDIINDGAFKAAFGADRDTPLRVVVTDGQVRITRTRLAMIARSRELVPYTASLFTGGGLLDVAANLAGYETKFGVEIESSYADVFARNHPKAAVFNMSVEEVFAEEMAAFQKVGVLVMGVPCEPYSKIRTLNKGGQEKRDKNLPPEAHDLGDMFYWGLRAVEATNPFAVVIEEVPDFLKSAAGHVTMRVLKRLGYHVDSRVVNPVEYGEITGRKRAVVVASMTPVRWPDPSPATRRLGELLDPGEHDWFDRTTKNWVFDHWENQTAKGNGFAPPILTADTPVVPTIKRRYFAGQGDNPVVGHPTKPGVVRWLTVKEVARIHGVPDNYLNDTPKTIAGEVMGQGVVVGVFKKILEANKA